MKLTKPMQDFLKNIVDVELGVDVLQFVTRERDRARQQCRKAGLAVYIGGRDRAWHITPAGRAALAEKDRTP